MTTTSGSTIEALPKVTKLVEGGIGLIGVEPNPSLYAYIEGLHPEADLAAFIRATARISTSHDVGLISRLEEGGVGIIGSTSNPDLKAYIFSDQYSLADMVSFYRALNEEPNTLRGIYRSIEHSDMGVSGYYESFIQENLKGFVRGTEEDQLSVNSWYRGLSVGEAGRVSGYYESFIRGDLSGFVRGTKEDQLSINSWYRGLSVGEAGSVSGYYESFIREDLPGFVRGTKEDQLSVNSWYRTLQSGINQLGLSITSQHIINLPGMYRPTHSGNKDLSKIVIKGYIPPDLYADYQGMSHEEISSNIEAVPPISITATISGEPKLDITAEIHGFNIQDLYGSISGYVFERLLASVDAVQSDKHNLNTIISGFTGIDIEDNLYAYIIPSTNLSGNLPAQYKVIQSEDLKAVVPLFAQLDEINATITGEKFEGWLDASITATGGHSSLITNIRSVLSHYDEFSAAYEGRGRLDLTATINDGPQGILSGTIIGAGYKEDIGARLSTSEVKNISGDYVPISGNLLAGSVTAIEPSELSAIVRPKIFYLDSAIPINTYPFRQLCASINADSCGYLSHFDDLRTSITAIQGSVIKASILSITGQLTKVQDIFELLIKPSTVYQDWVFMINKPLCLMQDSCEVIITNHPHTDLTASIEATPEFADLSAEIEALFYRGIVADSPPILGEWVNPKTGERKLIRVYFQGVEADYYYSHEANDTFPNLSNTQLEIVVETYNSDAAAEEELLLVEKQNTKTCIIKDLSDFKTIDEAVRFAITCAVSEIHMDLASVIYGVGQYDELTAGIESLEDMRKRALWAKYGTLSPEAVDRLSSSIIGSGDIKEIRASISSNIATNTFSFIDISGTKYKTTLVLNESGSYSIILTPCTPQEISQAYSTPDVRASISGIAFDELSLTVTGHY